jgi:hypothetical protein
MQIIFALLVGVIVFCGYLLFDHAIIRKKQRESQRTRLAPDGSPMRDDYNDAPIGLNDEPSPRARTMAAILRGLGVTVDALGLEAAPNAEAHLKPPEEMRRLFRGLLDPYRTQPGRRLPAEAPRESPRQHVVDLR